MADGANDVRRLRFLFESTAESTIEEKERKKGN